MRKQPFSVRPFRDPERPALKFIVQGFLEGKRLRRFFGTEMEAKTFANLKNTEIGAYGVEASAVPPWLRLMAQRCQDKLAPYKRTIEEATKTLHHFPARYVEQLHP